jgi:3-deoxy-7-phosphoheptulonate synthase
MLWCGERTRQLDAAHIEFLRGVGNPLGVKVSDKMDPAELVALVAALNPANTPGRLAVITRMGAAGVRKALPGLVGAVTQAGQVVTWVCDPMHGNTESVAGYKTRRYENVRAEVEAFFDVHDSLGTVPGGVHLEMTGDDVTECLGGGSDVAPGDLESAYRTQCDPRLNAAQALELSFYVASRLRARKERMQAAGGVPV